MSESSSFSPPSLVMATIGLSLATFMQVLDTTIASSPGRCIRSPRPC